jgi:ATP-dependent Clp protease adaptor protein ClpS
MAEHSIIDPPTPVGIPKVPKPHRWKVIIMHDSTIPLQFVVSILLVYFGMDVLTAHKHAQEVYTKGTTIAGVFTLEIAETKISLVGMVARQNNLPLRLIVEPE